MPKGKRKQPSVYSNKLPAVVYRDTKENAERFLELHQLARTTEIGRTVSMSELLRQCVVNGARITRRMYKQIQDAEKACDFGE